MKSLEHYWSILFVVVLGVISLFSESAYAAGKPPKPPTNPIDPAIVYVTYGGSSGIGNLAIANVDGTNQKIIFSNAVAQSPSWSPDGTKIIFASDGSNLPGRGIYVLSMNRTTGQAIGVPQKITAINSTFLGMANPVWSPVQVPGTNRHFIAYSDSSTPDGNDYSVHLVDPGLPGSAFKLSSPVVSTAGIGDLRLSWSPDATRLVVSRGRDDSQIPPYDIQIVTLQTSGCPVGEPVCEVQPRISLVRDIIGSDLHSADTILNPQWSNHGENIAVAAGDIWTIPVANPEDAEDLTNTNKITPPDRHETLPTWSPDDSQIAYRALGNLCNTKDKTFQGIVVRNVDANVSFPDGCKEKILIKDGNFPSWWRNHGVPQP